MADRIRTDLRGDLDPPFGDSGHAMLVPSGYRPSHTALARIIGYT